MLEKFTYNDPCPVCLKYKGCLKAFPNRGRPFVLCYRIESEFPTALAGYKHFVDGLGEPSNYQDKPEIASIERRHMVYSHMLKLLRTDSYTYHDLLGRGFDDNDLPLLNYRTVENVAQELSKIYTLEGIGGFYKRDDEWTMLYPKGFFIPILDNRDRISSLQIRLKYPTNNQKYIWFSSSSKELGSPIEPCLHHRIRGNTNRLWITEGALKADYINIKTGEAAVAILGVNYHHNLVSDLILNSYYSSIILVFDMDWRINDKVKSALNHLGELIITDTGIQPTVACWNNYKGIDEALLNKEEIKYQNFVDWQWDNV